MKKLILTLTPTNYTLPFNEDTLTWFYSFYTAEQKAKYSTDLAYCESQGWIIPNHIVEVISTIPDLTDQSTVWLDIPSNTLIKTFRGVDVTGFYNYFIQQNDNLKPIRDYYNANPSHGSYSITLVN